MESDTLDELLTENSNASLCTRVKHSLKNWAIDTSAKAAVYTPMLATIEASQGLDTEQIIAARLTSLALDAGIARAYTKLADYGYNLYSVNMNKGGMKAWAVDTTAMVSTYGPVYAGILYAYGADAKQIAAASTLGIFMAALTSRPFRKYVLAPWRKYTGFISKTNELHKHKIK